MFDVARTDRRNGNAALVIFLINLFVAGLIIIKGSGSSAFFWTALAVIASALPYLFAFFKRKIIFYEPIYLFLSGTIFTYIAYLLFSSKALELDQEALAYVMTACTFGAVAFTIGYKLNFGNFLAKILPIKNYMVDEKILGKICLKLYGLWLIFTILPFLPLGGLLDSMKSLFQNLMMFVVLGGVMIDIYLYAIASKADIGRYKYLLRSFLLACVYFVQCFLSGFSGAMASVFGVTIIAYIKGKNTLPSIPKIIAIIVTLVVFLGYIVPYTKIFREAHWQGENIGDSLEYANDEFITLSQDDKIEVSLTRFSDPLFMGLKCHGLRKQNVNISRYSGFLSFLARFVPRFIWKDKPVSFNGNQVGRELGVIQEDDFTTSISLPLLSNFILNGGLWGVILGMLGVGTILRLYWEWLIIRTGGNFLAFVVYFIILFSWIFGGDEIGSLVVANVGFLGYLYIFLGFAISKEAHMQHK